MDYDEKVLNEIKSQAREDHEEAIAYYSATEDVQKEVDCFFIHPTGFFLKDWNFDMSKDSSTFQRTELMLATQASVFSKITNIYAPVYRQATFAAISTNQKNNSALSLELAYQDVKKS